MSATTYGIPQGWIDSVSSVTATGPYQLGVMRWEKGNVYQYVYNDSTGTIAVGYGVILRTASTGYSVTVTSVSAVQPLFGVIQNATATTATYHWVLKRGFGQYQMSAAASAGVGAAIGLGINGLFQSQSGATGYLGGWQGWAIDAAASGASGAGYFNCI
jgi:hypothetical protein